MLKRILALMLALVMVMAILPTAAFAQTGDGAETVTDEDGADGSTDAGETQASEDVTGDEDADGADDEDDEDVPDGETPSDDARPSEDVTGEGDPDGDGTSDVPGLDEGEGEQAGEGVVTPGEPEGDEGEQGEEPVDEPAPEEGEGADGSDMGIATIAFTSDDEAFMKNYFKAYQGEYILPDGSGWKVTIDSEGNLTMDCGDSGTTASVDSITKSGDSIKTVTFASPDWYNSSKKAQTLTLNWTADTNSKTYNFFKASKAVTFYDNTGKTVVKGFNQYSYFMPADGMYSFEYFAGKNDDGSYKYVGTYTLSDAYHVAYGDVIDDWSIEVKEDGHVYLHTGEDEEDKREVVATAGSSGPDRVTTMYVCVPDWYTAKECVVPAVIKLTWNYDSTAKTVRLYFTSEALAVFKPDEKGNTGNKAVAGRIPALRFELLGESGDSKNTEFAKSKLIGDIGETGVGAYVGKYIVNDESGEYIEIAEDGAVVLFTGGQEYTPLYYELTDAKWLAGKEGTDVKSIVFSAPNWFPEKNQKFADADRQTVTMTWSAANMQFTAEEKTCYAPESEEVVRTYTANTKYNTEESLKEAAAYFDQYVKGEYTLNDDSGWKIKVEEDTEAVKDADKWKIYIDFDGDEDEDYVAVENPAPVFKYDKSHTKDKNTETTLKEWGNDGRYLSTITVPVPGWYTDEDCTRDAIVTLDWNGELTNPIDDHQFNVEPIAIYRTKDGETECKYFAGTFYSDADREKGEDFLASIGVAGTYRPTAAKDKWYIEISEEGKVTIYATDAQGEEHTHSDVAMDLTIDKTKKNGANLNYGNVTAVTDIKVVIPEWRTAGTNDTLANIMQCGEVTFTFVRDTTDHGSSYFAPSNTYIYADTNDGSPWEVVDKSSKPGYNKDLLTKIYKEDRAYTDANKEAAKAYFKDYAGTYYIDDASLDYEITITEEGEIYWGDYASGKAPLPADVHFDAIKDENHDGKVGEDETEPIPGTISVWLNGYTTENYTTSTKEPHYKDGTQRANLTWNDTNEWNKDDEILSTAHKFKTSGKSVKGYLDGVKNSQVTFALDKYYTRGEEVAAKDFVPDGIYETTDGNYRIEIKTDESTGKTSYTFYRPDVEAGYPLKLFSTGNAAYLRGLIGTMKKKDVYIVVTKGPYEGFLLTAYEVTYNDLDGKGTTSSSAPTVTLPLGTRFTNYALGDTGENKNIIVAGPGVDKEDGTPYSRLSLALHSLTGGETIYLEDDIEVGFAAKLPDGVGEVTIDGQGHTITRDSYVNPGTLLMDPEMGKNEAVMSILMNPGISLMELEEEGESGELPQEHYTGAILQVGAEDTVTLKNITIDGEGQWEIDEAKLEYDKLLNQDYDINVLDDPDGGHPITVKEGNVVSTDSLIKVNGGTLILDGVTLENFFAGDGYDDDRHFIDFMSAHDGKLEVTGKGAVFQHNASRAGVCIGNTDADEIRLSGCTTMEDNYCFGGNGGMIVAMEGTQVYMEDGTKVVNNVAADTNGVFIQLHKKTDGVKDGDNKGTIYSRLHMDGGIINNNVGLRGGSYGWGQTIYLYNGGAFTMNGGEICNNMGAGISSIYQQPSADALQLNAGKISGNTCSLIDEGMSKEWALDIAIMNIVDIGEEMTVEQNFVVGAAAILGGYASGDEYLTNDGVIKGNISVYSYFNNEGRTSTVVNNNRIEGSIRLENGSMIKNGEDGVITGNVTVRGALTGSAGESSFHNEGKVEGKVELAEGAHMYNSGEIEGDVTVKSGGTLVMNCNDGDSTHGGGIVYGDVTVYPDGLMYAEVTPTLIEGTLTFEYEDEEDRERMEEVLQDSGITCENVVYKKHVHSAEFDEEVIEPKVDKCTEPWVTVYTCQTCGKVVETKETEPTGHKYYVAETADADCTTGQIEHIRCENCSAYNSAKDELKLQKSAPNGHHYVELTQLYIPPTEYGSGHIYYKCTECGDLLEFEINEVSHGYTKHSFQDEDGALIETAGKVTKEATCTEDGEMTFECDECHTKITVTIPATGHTYPLIAKDFAEDCVTVDEADSTCATSGHITYAPICEDCGEPSESYTYKVNLKKLEHVWGEWENADGVDYPCTMEREQVRHCQSCGETETRLGGEETHDWEKIEGTEMYRCEKCKMVQNGVHVDYDVNGGVATRNLLAQAKLTYAPGETVTLWQPDDETDEDERENAGINEDGKWTRTTAMGNAVFVGWSTVEYGAEPFYDDAPDDLNEKRVTTVTINADNPADVPVYAVWALDRNGNDIADYEEGKVTLEYNANGGIGEVPAEMKDLLKGGSYPLVTVCDLTKGANVFAGWSTAKTDVVIPATGVTIAIATDDAGNPVSRVTWDSDNSVDLITSPYTVPANAATTVTLYAVYAVDDGSGNPAFDDNYYHVEYYAPGATANRHYTVDEDNGGLFYTCNDHHNPGDEAALMSTQSASVMVYKIGAVLIGFTDQAEWKDANHDLITSETDEKYTIIETVEIPEDSNAKVYAVWAVDSNNNGIRDYNEKPLPHAYFLNDRLKDHSKGDSPKLPLKDESGQQISESTLRITNRSKLPYVVPNVLTGYYVPFPGTNEDSEDANITFENSNVIGEADLYDVNGEKVLHHYVQIGWSGYPHIEAKSEQDAANWVIGYKLEDDPENSGQKKDDNGYLDEDGIFYREIKDERFINAYVVWAIDDNKNGTADFLEDPGDVDPDPDDGNDSGDDNDSDDDTTGCDGGVNCPSRPYVDVDQSKWYHESVDFVIVEKLMLGKGELVFDPDGITTRAELVTILYRMDGENAATEGAPFEDVPAGQWFYDAVSWAAENGIVDGYGDGRFGPNDTVTREQMAAILYRYASFKGYDMTKTSDLAGYTDAEEVSGWADAAMRWVVAEGIINGMSETTLSPSGDSTRAQVAAVIMRFCKLHSVCDGGESCPSRDYTDVDKSAWYHSGVDYAVKNGLMNGTGVDVFAPNGTTTRAMVVTILYRLDGEPAVTEGVPFDDVPAGQWFYDAVSWAAENGIVDGYGDGRFGPDDTVTREQMAAILYRYAGYKGCDVAGRSDLTGYTDAGAVSGWADAAMRWVVAEGIIDGTSATTLSPSGDSTRAQVATVFMRFCENVVE